MTAAGADGVEHPSAGGRDAALPMLAIETSQRQGGVALLGPDGRTFEEPRRDGAADELATSIDQVVRRAGLTPRDLRTVAVSIGPGGFTGLRIAVSTAKMLAEALGTTLLGVPSALVAAEALAGAAGDRSLVLLATKRGRGGTATASDDTTWATPLVWDVDGSVGWRLDDANLEAGSGGGRLVHPGELSLGASCVVVGERSLLPTVAERCDRAGIPWLEPRFEPLACLHAARRWMRRHGATDPFRLSPLYPREPEAATLWRMRRGDTA